MEAGVVSEATWSRSQMVQSKVFFSSVMPHKLHVRAEFGGGLGGENVRQMSLVSLAAVPSFLVLEVWSSPPGDFNLGRDVSAALGNVFPLQRNTCIRLVAIRAARIFTSLPLSFGCQFGAARQPGGVTLQISTTWRSDMGRRCAERIEAIVASTAWV